MTDWRLDAYKAWKEHGLSQNGQMLIIEKPDFQSIAYYSAPTVSIDPNKTLR